MDTLPLPLPEPIRPLLQSWSTIETWAARFFLFLGVLTIFPWILLVLVDAGLYVWRYLIVAPIARWLWPGAEPLETAVVGFTDEDDEDEDEDDDEEEEGNGEEGRTKAIRRRRRRRREVATEVKELPDGLDRAWKKDL